MCFQDLNENQQLDRNGYLPSEPWGMSRNPNLTGPPTWEMIAFDTSSGTQIILIK
jgi:uncharacterized protein (DUF2141 family)